jgi:peptidoglycan/xylan/chitin deacetylase (PgdA/CDA1 family)
MTRTTVLHVARALGLFALSRWVTRRQQRILCYHGIWTGPAPHYGDCLFMSPTRFAARMRWLRDAGYSVIPLDEACHRLRDGRVRARDVVITIDDAWSGIVEHMLPVLARHGMPCTLYVTTYYVLARRPVLNVLIGYLVERGPTRPGPLALGLREDLPTARWAETLSERMDALPTLEARWQEVQRLTELFGVDLALLERSGTFRLMTPEQIRAARDDGVDVQLHTHTHRLHDFSSAAVQRELALNRSHLSEILGTSSESLVHFCYPSGEYVPQAFPALRSAAIASATTTEAGLNAPGSEPLALRRILDCESMTDIELEARLSGFWHLVSRVRQWWQGGRRAPSAPAASAAGR